MKTTLKWIFGFITMITIGATLAEGGREITADALGYEASFVPKRMGLVFSSPEMQSAFRELKLEYPQHFRETEEWDTLLMIDQRDHAIIEGVGLLVTLLVSYLSLYFFRRRMLLMNQLGSREIIFALLGLFIVRDTAYNVLFGITGFFPCDVSKIWAFLEIPYIIMYPLYILIGCIQLLMITYYLPQNERFHFWLGGLVGGIVGAILWAGWLGYYLTDWF